jgi:hypothetical protein
VDSTCSDVLGYTGTRKSKVEKGGNVHEFVLPNQQAIDALRELAKRIVKIEETNEGKYRVLVQEDPENTDTTLYEVDIEPNEHWNIEVSCSPYCKNFAIGVKKAGGNKSYGCEHIFAVSEQQGLYLYDSEGLLNTQQESASAIEDEKITQESSQEDDNEDVVRISEAGIKRVTEQIEMIQKFVATALKPDIDYLVLKGNSKPTLLKAGAIKIISAFNCYSDFELVSHELDIKTGWENYVVKCNVKSMNSGATIATGMGTCNSFEKKYRYVQESPLCPVCGRRAIIKSKEEFGGGYLCFKKKGGCGAKFPDNAPEIIGQVNGQVENEHKQDLSNTYIKIAEKRAEVNAALRLPAVAGQFTQDLETGIST